MIDIKVRTYNEALLLSRCTEIQKYAPNVPDEAIVDIYHYLSANPHNKVGMSNGTIYYMNAAGETTNAHSVETTAGFDKLLIGASVFNVVNASSNDDSGCGGCASNNNNNNNNNNNS